MHNLMTRFNRDGIPFLDMVVQVAFNQQQAVVDRVAEEDPGKAFRNDTGNAQMTDNLRRLFTGGTTAEVLAGDNDITRLNLSGQFGTQRRKRRIFSYHQPF